MVRVTDTQARLRRCLLAVLPDLADDEVPGASAETVAEWDSLHALMLMAVVEESFGLRIPAADYPRLRSYAALLNYLRGRTGHLYSESSWGAS